MTRTYTLLAAAAAAAALALTGCGVEERIVHLQAAPTETAVGAPLPEDAAQRIATRVLAEAASASSDEEREAVIVGPARRVTDARIAAKVQSDAPSELVLPAEPTILAISDGSTWPRAILASTFDEGAQVQSVHILVSDSATDPFQLFATAPMFAGTSVPSLGEFADGAAFETGTKDEPIEAVTVLEAYAKALAFPKPKADDSVSLEDPMAESLKRNATAQNKALGDLADLTQKHAVKPDSAVRFETADGGNLLFGQAVRTDTITLTSKAKELKIDDTTLQKLSGKKQVTKQFTVTSLENVLIVAPASGPSSLIGAEEIVLTAKGE